MCSYLDNAGWASCRDLGFETTENNFSLKSFYLPIAGINGLNVKLFFFAWRINLINRKQTKTEFVSAVYTLKCVNKH